MVGLKFLENATPEPFGNWFWFRCSTRAVHERTKTEIRFACGINFLFPVVGDSQPFGIPPAGIVNDRLTFPPSSVPMFWILDGTTAILVPSYRFGIDCWDEIRMKLSPNTLSRTACLKVHSRHKLSSKPHSVKRTVHYKNKMIEVAIVRNQAQPIFPV
jgi:hypothetical protein